MDKRPLVGVTGNARRWAPAWWCTRIALWLVGARAARISVKHTVPAEQLAALVIGGGNDISPEHYGGDINDKVRSDPERDRLETSWIKLALEKELPLLGICRGAQLINVVFGGTLHQDIRSLREKTSNRPGLLPTKQVFLEQSSTLANICRSETLRVNSLHHQAVKEPGKGVVVVAYDRDRIVQAIESSTEGKVIGVQWHPEYLFYLPSQLRIFRWLLKVC